MRIDWRTIRHDEQRYLTSGDWFWTGDVLNIRISHMSNPYHEFCLGLHELTEAMLCYFMDVPQSAADDFDIPYEAEHAAGKSHYHCGCPRKEFSDPGSDIHAPYHWQHRIADVVERTIAVVLRIDWEDYDREVDDPVKYEASRRSDLLRR